MADNISTGILSGLYEKVYNPDVLSCLANLSSDEVFTPPEIVNKMLDMLPQELFSSPDTKFLDPAVKTGVYLREIAKRLIKGLEAVIPDRQQRIDHIFKNQLYGIAITELTSLLSRRSLYCSKYANSAFSVTHFENSDGNIRFKRIPHSFDKSGRCIFCGASETQYDRGEEREYYAYEWIHTLHPEEIFGMKFDVIISNPPYQLNDGGGTGKSSKPIYQLFVDTAKKLKPRYITMIIPSRWFSGGKGLDEFRKSMLNDKKISKLVDFENFREVFPGVDLAGGACYFLWERDKNTICEVTNVANGVSITANRPLDEFDTFIRSNLAVDIVKKINSYGYKKHLSDRVYPRLPFGIPTTYIPVNKGIPCHFTQRIGICFVDEKDYSDIFNIKNKWKFLVPKAPIAGQTDFSKPVGFYYEGNTRIAKPGEICSESWLVAGAFDTKEETLSFKSYLLTKVVRFLLLQTVVSQNISRKNYCFIPDLDVYNGTYSDEILCKMWNISDAEYELIKSKIGEIGGENNG